MRGASYVLVGRPRLDARGFAVVTARPTIALAELVALGLQPAGANGQRGLTLHTLHDAPLPALLSAQDHRLGLDYLTPQIVTSRRITY